MEKKGSREQFDAIACDQLIGRGDRVRRLAAVILADHLKLLAVDAACRIDLADLDRVVGDGGAGGGECGDEEHA